MYLSVSCGTGGCHEAPAFLSHETLFFDRALNKLIDYGGHM